MSARKRLAGLAAAVVAALTVPLAAPASAQTAIDICATTGSVTMPDSVVVPIWSYVLGDCTGATGTATLPGPEIRITEGTSLDITLHVDAVIGENVSIVVPTLTGAPDITGVAGGASTTYSWTSGQLPAGTHLYESGINPATQIPMGLYGAIVVELASPTAAVDQVVLLSALDVELNANPASFTRNDYAPEYFLINGAAAPAVPSIAGAPGDLVLLRYLNATARDQSMSLLGARQTIVAKEGRSVPYQRSVVAELIPAGHTVDAEIQLTSDQAGRDLVVASRNGRLVNNLGGESAGGMQFKINVGAAAPIIYLSFNGNGSVGGVNYQDEDILAYDNGTYSMFFDGSANGIVQQDLDAVDVLGPDHFIFSVRRGQVGTIPGLGAVDDSDIIEYNAGVFTMLLQGSTVDLTTGVEDIDAVHMMPDGDLLISTLGFATLPMSVGIRNYLDEDIARYDIATGFFERYFDGSDVNMDTANGEDVTGVTIDADGDILLTTLGNHVVPSTGGSLSGDNDDIAEFVPVTLGATTSGLFNDLHVLDVGVDQIDGLDIAS